MALAEGLSIGEKYDVFLSFRGPDTRDGFADCLFVFLKEAGLSVFMDDEELRVGESIGRKIREAIYDSKIFVPVFSKGYASSKWCLKEIAWMADCLEEFPGEKEMHPVFYDVEARDVKLKTDLYTKALLEHEETTGRETVERWKKALIKVPDVKGWNPRDAKGQGKLIREIRRDISQRLPLKHRKLPEHFIGFEEQVQHIMNALDYGSSDMRIVVIHGMGGIGKTTLAMDVFNKIYRQYQGCSFLSDVRESTERDGILSLQNKLMRDILGSSSPNFYDVNDAMNCIQRSLRNKDVLVVLDDVSDMDQIQKLVGMGDWVGLGSRVIITTRNLSCVANVKEIENIVTISQGKKIFIYRMRELSFDNSLQLLCRHAFGQHKPPPGYEQLTGEVISFTRGVPLAIEVMGSCLKRREVTIWKDMLNRLRKGPGDRLYQKILMSSYETLCDEEKEIFLDIAFFFAGHDKTSAFHYWQARGFSPEISVDTLISNALVKITYPNEFWMHDLLKDLGREVVRKQSNGNLGMCSRLCNEDAKRLLLKTQGTKHVKALKLDSTNSHNFTPAELLGLSGLTFLELCGGNFVGDFKDCCLSELLWLSWRDCALDFRGTNFYLENLVMLKLSQSSGITESWSGWEQFKTARNLKVLELQDLDLTTTPDLSSFLSLERLTVFQCDCLARIDPSIGNLESLNYLEMIKFIDKKQFSTPNLSLQLPSSICNITALSELVIQGFKLNQLPENIGELKGLKVMRVTRCEFLRTLPNSIGDLESLINLNLSGDAITELPESIGKLRNLTKLNVRRNRLRRLPATIGDLDRLKVLDASYNRDLQGEILGEFGKLPSLKSLDLSWTGICWLPWMMVQLSCLESLKLKKCLELHGLPDLPTCLTDLVISSTIQFPESKNLTAQPSPMPAPYSSIEFVHTNLSISNAECMNSLETTNLPWSPADVSPGKSRFHLPSSICNVTALSKLLIRGFKLNQLPENIGELKGLKVMRVTRCDFLRTLPDSIGDLESLFNLNLSHNGITELPKSIGKLRNLTEMNVSFNRLRRLPASIGDLDRLKVLDASYNRDLQGEIPGEFGKLPSLKYLDLSRTGICGLPSTMVQLSCLKSLKLENCLELHGLPDLPTCLTDLVISSTIQFPKSKNLTAQPSPMPAPYSSIEFVHTNLSISNAECVNSLETTNHPWSPADVSPGKSRFHLPSSICNVTALSKLLIRGFKLNQLPENIGELKGLKVMRVTRCDFLRTLPDSIGDLESLFNLNLSHNGITKLPKSIGKLRNLTEMNVSFNRLRRLPASIGDLDRLKVLDASCNRDLQGEIPGEFGKLPSLKYLDLSRTGICGLPSTMVQLSCLESLKLENCPELHGLPDLPMCLTHLFISSTTNFPKSKNLAAEPWPMPAPYSSTEFVHIDLSLSNAECVNSLETTNHPWSPADVSQVKSRFHPPSSICSLKALSRLEICSIKLNQFPENIGELKCLKVMKITGCEFLRTLPDSIGYLESLFNLNLSHNGITELPESIGKLRNLTEMNVSNNRLRRLPATIGDLDRLVVLDASDNSDLHGEIPGEFGKLRSLRSLKLSSTGICGLPSTMVQLASLYSLYLISCNEIQELPELPTRLIKLRISSRSLKAVLNLSSLTNLVHLSLLNGGDHDDYGHNPQVPPYLCDRLNQLSRLRYLRLSCPNPSVLSLLPPGLERLSLYHSTSLSCWERLSYLGSLWGINLRESIASDIRLDGLESLTNLERLKIAKCEFLERVHDISRLGKLKSLELLDCPKLVEIGGLAQPPASLQHVRVRRCHSILCLPDRLETVSPSALHLGVRNCSKLRDFDGPYDDYNQGGMNPK